MDNTIFYNPAGLLEITVSCEESRVFYIFLHNVLDHELTVSVSCAVPGAYADVRIVHMQKNSATLSLKTVQRHTAAHTGSNVVVKGLLQDNACCLYNGIIYVAPEAHNTHAQQKSHTLVLSKDAHMQATPALEVLTDAVHCKHGSAIATLAERELEYLAARGISGENAQKILIESFFYAILDDVKAREFFVNLG